jgi:hypothetical protein
VAGIPWYYYQSKPDMSLISKVLALLLVIDLDLPLAPSPKTNLSESYSPGALEFEDVGCITTNV